MQEWKKSNYWEVLKGKTLLAPYGGERLEYVPGAQQNIIEYSLPYLQGDDEEADTLIAFHTANLSEEDVAVRASDTDVLVILSGASGRQI